MKGKKKVVPVLIGAVCSIALLSGSAFAAESYNAKVSSQTTTSSTKLTGDVKEGSGMVEASAQAILASDVTGEGNMK